MRETSDSKQRTFEQNEFTDDDFEPLIRTGTRKKEMNIADEQLDETDLELMKFEFFYRKRLFQSQKQFFKAKNEIIAEIEDFNETLAIGDAVFQEHIDNLTVELKMKENFDFQIKFEQPYKKNNKPITERFLQKINNRGWIQAVKEIHIPELGLTRSKIVKLLFYKD